MKAVAVDSLLQMELTTDKFTTTSSKDGQLKRKYKPNQHAKNSGLETIFSLLYGDDSRSTFLSTHFIHNQQRHKTQEREERVQKLRWMLKQSSIGTKIVV